jgi:YYY domain-containing protein
MEFALIARWVLAFLLLGLAATPLSAWLFRERSPGAFAIPVALAVLAVVGHLAGYIAFGLPAALVGVVAILALSAVAARRIDVREVVDPRSLAEHALVFALGFALIGVVRGIDPAAAPLPVSVGEKFLDFGLLATLDRTDALPPESMWFAGETVQYHYGGHLLTSLLSALTWTDPAYAYNLGLAGLYATLLTAAYGLAGSIAATYTPGRDSVRRQDTISTSIDPGNPELCRDDLGKSRPGVYRVHDRLAAGLGAFFVGLAGNMDTFVRALGWLLPGTVTDRVADLGVVDRSVLTWQPQQFSYFDASRVVPVDPSDPATREAATEFPLFAWLNGDLHAHMVSQPFMLLAAAVLLAAWRADPPRRRLLLVGALPPVVGILAFLNVWSFPTVLGLTLLAVFFAPWDPATLLPRRIDLPSPGPGKNAPQALEELRRLGFAVGGVLAVTVLGVLWTAPYWPTAVFRGPSLSVEYWAPWTPAWPLLVVHGAFLAGFAVYLSRRLATKETGPVFVLLVGLGLFGVATAVGAPALALTIPLIVACWWLLRRSVDVGFEAVLIVAGAGLVLLVELVTLKTTRPERFNVIFKPYVQVWLFWAVGLAVVLPRIASGWSGPDRGLDRRRLRAIGAVLAAVLVVAAGLYPAFALYNHVDDGSETTDQLGPTLDATAYLEVQYPAEAPAIRWLEESVDGQPAIVTEAPGHYWWAYDRSDDNVGGASAPASLTGIPTVAGWFHEAQYRGDEAFNNRVADVRDIYTGEATKQRQLLAAYDVQYVYVGPAERERYDEITVSDLPAVSVQKEWERVTIYAVDHGTLATVDPE